MPLTRLTLDDFRNFHSVQLLPAQQLNFIFGDNGSGKTSVLEALSTLALGRSFRTRKYRHLIRYDADRFCLFGEFKAQEQKHRIGVLRPHTGLSQFRLNDQSVGSALELAALMPMQVLDHQSFQLFDGGPAERRHFIDWLVFHVKPEFRRHWVDYGRCLKQRNQVLRSDRITDADLAPWDSALSRLGEKIAELRQDVLSVLLAQLPTFTSACEFLSDSQLQIVYSRGWDNTISLADTLKKTLARDQKQGFTHAGPHKADLHFEFRGIPVGQVFSRGQQKSLVSALYMAQIQCLLQTHDGHCMLLVDDLPAELDEGNSALLCRWMAQLPKTQLFVTGIEKKTLLERWPSAEQLKHCKLFHVKHGQIIEHPCEWG